jgi:hypothetical protein
MQARPEYFTPAVPGYRTRLLDEHWVETIKSHFSRATAGTAKVYVRTDTLKPGSELYKLFCKAAEAKGLVADRKQRDCWVAFSNELKKVVKHTKHVGSVDIWLIAGK